jgi:hypothetical protein
MNSFERMDIFFAVTTVAVVAVALVVCLIGWRLARLLRAIGRISEEAADEARALRADLGDVRETVRREGFKLRHLFGLAGKVGSRFAGRGRSKKN